MLQSDPSNRPLTSDLIENEWLTNKRMEPIDLDLISASASSISGSKSSESVSNVSAMSAIEEEQGTGEKKEGPTFKFDM